MVLNKLISSVCLLFLIVGATSATGQNWPSFRGDRAQGLADDQDLPIAWQVDNGENIRWRSTVPGMGHSSPVIWDNRIFVTTAVTQELPDLVLGDEGGIDLARDDEVYSWQLHCLDKLTGETIWSREAYSGVPSAARHVKASQTNSTPVTDGRYVAAIFGAEGLAVFDFEGSLQWKKDLGVLDPGLFGDADSQWGYASSPVIYEESLIVQVDRHADSFIAAYRLTDGRQLWRNDRDEKPVWATPTLYFGSDRTELIVVGGDYDRGLDPATGKELWRFARDYQVKTTTPVVAHELVILSGGYRGKPLFALRTGGSGDLSLTEGQTRNDWVAWVSEPGGPYTSTPIVVDEVIYFVRNTGILTALELESGNRIYRHRLSGNFSASPVAADGKIYFASEEGVVSVVRASREPKVLASNDMGEPCMASPAISDGVLFIRTRTQLFAITEEAERESAARGAARPPSDYQTGS